MEITQLKQIYQIMSDNDFDEIELRLGSSDRVKMTRMTSNTNSRMNDLKVQANEPEVMENKDSNIVGDISKTEIRSELVGVFQFMDEDESFFPKVGDQVAMGEKLGKILSLNSIKDIKSTVDGRICEIAVNKNDIVDYGHLLFVIEDSEEAKA